MVASPNLVKLRELTESLDQVDTALNSFFNLALDFLAVSTPNKKFVKLNPTWEKLGWTLEELQSKPFVEFVHPEDRQSTEEAFDKAVLGREKIFYFRNRYLCKDGSYKILCWTAQFDPKNELVYAIARDYEAMLNQVVD